MIELRELRKSYGSRQALDGLSLTVPDGAAYGLIGPNGAGKSTVLRLLLGLESADSGTLSLDGMLPDSKLRRLKKRIGYVADSFGSYPGLEVGEYMSFFAACYELSGTAVKRRIQLLLEQAGLAGRAGQQVDSLSRGQQQRLSIARALLHDPRILLLDEPTEGIEPGSRQAMLRFLSELSGEGKTLLVSAKQLSELSGLCTHIGILDHGRMLIEGEVSAVLRSVNASSPIVLSVEGRLPETMRILRRDRKVRALSIRNRELWIHYDGTAEEETGLLTELVTAGIPVRGFHREAGDLEALFLRLNGNREERTVTSYETESDFPER